MSDTPRTDAVTNWDTERTLVAELCKELERELSALRKENEALRIGLRFYARGEHWVCEDGSASMWDTASGDPQNWYWRENEDDSAEGIEDGSIAKMVLLGQEIAWEGEEPAPLEDEPARALLAKEGEERHE